MERHLRKQMPLHLFPMASLQKKIPKISQSYSLYIMNREIETFEINA